MKVTSVKAVLTENDILSIINEFVEVKGLNIEKVEVEDFITIYGRYSKFSFKAIIGIGNVSNNVVYLKILDINLGRMRIFSGIKKMALKKVGNKFPQYGLAVQNDVLSVDMEAICKLIPKIHFKLVNIKVCSKSVEVEVEDMVYSSHIDDSKKILEIEGN